MKKQTHSALSPEDVLRLERMTAAELLAELDTLVGGEGRTPDEDTIEIYLNILDQKAPVLPDFDSKQSFVAFAETHHELLRSGDTPVKKEAVPKRKSQLLRTVALAAVLSSMLLVASFATEIRQVFYSITDGVLTFLNVQVSEPVSGAMELEEPDENGYRSLEEALEAYSLSDLTPTWIPQEFALTEIRVVPTEAAVVFMAAYLRGDEEMFIRVIYDPEENMDVAFEVDEDEEPELYPVGGIDYAITHNAKYTRVIWKTQTYTGTIAGLLTDEEARQMVDSIPVSE